MADQDPKADQAPSDEGRKLVRANYPDRAVAALETQRLWTPDVLLRKLGEFDPDNITHRDRRRMRQDHMIKMALWYSKAPAIRAEYAFECTDPRIAAAMTEIYGRAHINVMKTAFLMYDYGFQGAIKQFKLDRLHDTFDDPDTGEQGPVWDDDDVLPVTIDDLIPLPPENTRPALDKGRFIGIETPLASLNGVDDPPDKPVPPEWCMWFANEFEEEHRNWYGRARIDPAYRFWYSYWFLFHMRDRHAEMDADPALQVWYPPGTSRDQDGRAIDNQTLALTMGAKLRGGATIAWPSDVHVDEQGKVTTQKLWEAAFLTGGENLGAFQDLLQDLMIQKLRACLVPEQALIEPVRGTSGKAASATFVDIFTQSLEQSTAYVDRLINEYLIRPVVEANWGKDAPRCVKKTTGFQEEDLTLATALIEAAFNADPNALPIDFEELIRKTGLPMLTKAEQKEREEMAAATQEASPPEPLDPNAVVDAASGAARTPEQLQASQRRSGPRKYEREVIHLSATKIKRAPEWAQREGRRRDANVKALADRLYDVAYQRYELAFEAAAEAIAEGDSELTLGVGDVTKRMAGKIRDFIERALTSHNRRIENEVAGVYHAAGAAELLRLGLDTDSWDIGRDEVQEWARERGGTLIKTIDRTVVEDHVVPWLAKNLQTTEAGPADTERGIPVDAIELAARFTDKFSSYPKWMAERLVRTEARMGYNNSAADMWERVGIEDVVEFDGLGGKTGQTDEHCLRRNGQQVSIEEFRIDDMNEHPNGTLGAIPVTEGVTLRPLAPAGVLHADSRQPSSIYAITKDGEILSEIETGKLIA